MNCVEKEYKLSFLLRYGIGMDYFPRSGNDQFIFLIEYFNSKTLDDNSSNSIKINTLAFLSTKL